MNETKRMVAFFGVIALIIGLICLIAFWPEKDETFTCKVKALEGYTKVAELDYKSFECLQKEDDYVVAVADKVTKKQKETLNSAFKTNKKGVYLISLDNYSKEEANKIKEKLHYSDNAFENNSLLYVKKGKVEAYKEDILTTKDEVKYFLEENGIATKVMCNATPDKTAENINVVDYEGFECLYDQDEPYVLVLAQTTCGYCEQFKPVLNKFLGDNNTNAYLINIDKLSQEEASSLTSSFAYFETNTNWGTPLSLAIKNKEVIGDVSGYTDDTEVIKDMYVKAGILK